jgi:hypothetical protein
LARLIPLILLLALVVAVLVALRPGARPRSDRVYRPRWTPFGARPSGGDANWVVARAEVADVRDAYSSETIDADRMLYRCGGCQAWYHDSSVRALERENAGRCALCGSSDLREVRLV